MAALRLLAPLFPGPLGPLPLSRREGPEPRRALAQLRAGEDSTKWSSGRLRFHQTGHTGLSEWQASSKGRGSMSAGPPCLPALNPQWEGGPLSF